MSDRYQQLANSPLGKQLATTLGLPVPVRLRRYEPGQAVAAGPVLVGDAPGGRLLGAVRDICAAIGADVREEVGSATANGERLGALVFDATGIDDSGQLAALHTFFADAIRRMGPSSRLIVLGAPTSEGDVARRTAQRALGGFVRSVGKEMRHGATANLVRVAEGGERHLDSTLTFLLSARSAFVAGQPISVEPAGGDPVTVDDLHRPHQDRVAVVTGAARGIGAAIAGVLARGGAHVICLDVPGQGEVLSRTANRIGGSALQLDITAADAPKRLAEHVRERHGRVDVVVHNAGITRDKTLAGMDADRFEAVLKVNLASQERLDAALLDADLLGEHGRIVSVSSVSGIAGNRGQTNYATSKAGIIGRVEALGDDLADRGATANAVAPGFIETEMTSKMPVGIREAGRRMNSLNQGGLPVDVAETVAWLAEPASGGVTGQVVRVCGQSLLGA